ncbi:MAG: S1C family serine protease [Minisyncoccota bacterium]
MYKQEEKRTEPFTNHSASIDTSRYPIRHLSVIQGGIFLLTAVLSGFLGGMFAPSIVRFSAEHFRLEKTEKVDSDTVHTGLTNDNTEELSVMQVVDNNAAGVVSIVITKDMPKARSFFGNPFGGSMPFFFSPFGTPQDMSTPETERQQVGSGSGFFVSADGLVVTNKHVVADTDAEYTVISENGTEYQARVLARDPINDIAILKVDGQEVPVLHLGNSDTLKVGQTIIAIGNPLGEFSGSVTRGIVSGLQRNVSAGSRFAGDEEQLIDIIQIDAAINPGNSGGPLFNLKGEVIGVNVAMAQGAENIGFALPINQVKRIVEQVSATGKLSTPYIGVRSVMIDEKIQKENNLPNGYGALIVRGQNITDLAVLPGSPADKAGLRENDIILEVNGEKVDEKHPLITLINKYTVGTVLTLKVWHKGEVKEVNLTLEERQ